MEGLGTRLGREVMALAFTLDYNMFLFSLATSQNPTTPPNLASQFSSGEFVIIIWHFLGDLHTCHAL